MTEAHTDCRSEEGITVGLVDAIISILRILAKRDLTTPAVREALMDLGDDEDFEKILCAIPLDEPVKTTLTDLPSIQ